MVATPLRSPKGIIGYIPHDAIAATGDRVAIEVVVELSGRAQIGIPVPTTLQELTSKLADPSARGIRTLRQWLIDRARARFVLAYPHREGEIERIETIYWLCGRPERRMPFLR